MFPARIHFEVAHEMILTKYLALVQTFSTASLGTVLSGVNEFCDLPKSGTAASPIVFAVRFPIGGDYFFVVIGDPGAQRELLR